VAEREDRSAVEIVRNRTSVPFVPTSTVRVCSDAPIRRAGSNVRRSSRNFRPGGSGSLITDMRFPPHA
jgi:hypothetical protein